MDLIRCFIAIEIPDELKARIEKYISSLKQISPKIKWIKSTNLHITLKFLGEIQQDLLKQVQNELHDVTKIVNPFSMSVKNTGFFPNQFKPKVVWLGLQNDTKNSVFKLHEWIDNKLEPIGFKREKRRFSPHLTIGRIKFPDNIQELTKYINQYEFESCQFNVDQVVLMKSELKPFGAIYSKIKIYNFED